MTDLAVSADAVENVSVNPIAVGAQRCHVLLEPEVLYSYCNS